MQVDEIRGPKHLARLSGLLDNAFGVAAGQRYFDDFPIWEPTASGPQESLCRIGAFNQDRLIASACVRIAQLKSGGPDLPIALIGAVATDVQWRGKGLASQLVGVGCDWAKGRGAVLVMLWGSEHDLYRKLGFELGGEQVRVSLGAFSFLAQVNLSQGLVMEGWVPGIFELMRKREGGLRLGDHDRIWMERHRNVRWYWTGTPDAPTAYAGFGRGIDLENVVHEWGGDPSALAAILARIRAGFPEASLLASPAQMRDRFGAVASAEWGETEFLALVRILDPGRVLPPRTWIWGLDAA